ncbi:MAG: hypothetical protein ABIQ31_19395 [Ferruginibacter sp.]
MKKGWLLILVFCNACAASQKPVEMEQQDLPVCIGQLAEKFKAAEKQNPPRAIFSYRYKDKTVYYVTALCCDQVSDLYDDHCNLIGHPDGGFTGGGDGKLPDFNTAKTAEKLIWKDNR